MIVVQTLAVALLVGLALLGAAGAIGGIRAGLHAADYRKNPRRVTDPAGHTLTMTCSDPGQVWQRWVITDTRRDGVIVLADFHALGGAGTPTLVLEMERAYLWDEWDRARANL